jgi:hypothetical protein
MIVSHKTTFGHGDTTRVDLRDAARAWMRENCFFEAVSGFGVRAENVHFATTRLEKIEYIARLRCTHFIDDLPEVLDDPAFPPGVIKVLFTNGAQPPAARRHNAFAHWDEIAKVVLQWR